MLSIALIRLLETLIVVSLDKSLQFPEKTFDCEFHEAHIGSAPMIGPF